MNLLPKIFPRIPDTPENFLKSLMRQEARIGGELFGPVPEGRIRQFFCFDEHTWVWYEEWNDEKGNHSATTRYEVRPDGVIKAQGDKPYQLLGPEEARNFYRAVEIYGERVDSFYDRLLQPA